MLICTVAGMLCTYHPAAPHRPVEPRVQVYTVEHYRNSWPYNPHADYQLEGAGAYR